MYYEDIEYQHPDYENNVDRWEFYLRSYMGGQDYRDGSYLTSYLNEDKNAYSRRLALTPLDNHCRNVVHVYSRSYGAYRLLVTISRWKAAPT
jgi:hypothetical protein